MIGKAVKKIRKSRGMTQGDLSEKSGIGVSSISQIELNSASPQKPTVDRLCKALNVNSEYLFFMSVDPENLHLSCVEKRLFSDLHGAMCELLMHREA